MLHFIDDASISSVLKDGGQMSFAFLPHHRFIENRVLASFSHCSYLYVFRLRFVKVASMPGIFREAGSTIVAHNFCLLHHEHPLFHRCYSK